MQIFLFSRPSPDYMVISYEWPAKGTKSHRRRCFLDKPLNIQTNLSCPYCIFDYLYFPSYYCYLLRQGPLSSQTLLIFCCSFFISQSSTLCKCLIRVHSKDLGDSLLIIITGLFVTFQNDIRVEFWEGPWEIGEILLRKLNKQREIFF